MFVGIAISLTAKLLSSASPVALFALGEIGVWYDPSDLTTLFQDSAGTTPVTAANQTVGLMLDKSQGLVLGSELVTNGNFAVGTGWTGDWTFSGGIATGTPGGASLNGGGFTAVVGKTYLLQFDIIATNYLDVNLGGTFVANFSAPQTVRRYVVASSTAGVSFAAGGAINSQIDNVSIKLLAGNHALQATSTQRPTYQIDSSGRPYLLFDGVDDGMVTNTITPAIDKIQVFAGVRKLSDADAALLVGSNTASFNGSFEILAPISAGNYRFASMGSIEQVVVATGFSAPITNILTSIGDISGDNATIRINGVQAATSSADQGSGNYLAYRLYLGRRAAGTIPYNGRLYSLIVRFGANLTTGQITSTESWVNSKTGAY